MSEILDLRGKTITTYVAGRAADVLDHMADGDVLELFTDDAEFIDHDLRVWCRSNGTEILSSTCTEGAVRYRLRRHGTPPAGSGLALVVSHDGLEELLSPLAFALAAALEGAQVSLYFQGPAVRALTRRFRPRLHGPRRPFSPFARRGLARAGHVPPQEKIAELRRRGARLYACGPSMRHFGVGKEDLLHDDIVIAEYLTFMDVLRRSDIHLYA
ncbi:DsrE family protein [Streptomyces sp. S.PB5]|uniref:DsrE family protein n=1 Tax=Streptomyces sp. S.PB5 TaxID=3020844 RepID=UPI0025AF7387|nr:DsrE family protein [Streptomyces sp. S.PB5]MDN3029193.1 DsrE family protein [Streptomyces sp. S.PB5]